MTANHILALFSAANDILWQAGIRLVDPAGGDITAATVQVVDVADNVAQSKSMAGWQSLLRQGGALRPHNTRGAVNFFFVDNVTGGVAGFTNWWTDYKQPANVLIEAGNTKDNIVAHEFAHALGGTQNFPDIKEAQIQYYARHWFPVAALRTKFIARQREDLMVHDRGSPKKLTAKKARHLNGEVHARRRQGRLVIPAP